MAKFILKKNFLLKDTGILSFLICFIYKTRRDFHWLAGWREYEFLNKFYFKECIVWISVLKQSYVRYFQTSMLLTVQFKAIYNLKILRYVYFIVFALMCQIEEEGIRGL